MFTFEKFKALPLKRRHKNAGEHLRILYENSLPLDDHYRQMEAWLKLPPLSTAEEITDRFHLHMREASIEFQEHNLLIKRFDTLSETPYGPVHIYLEDLRSAFNIGNILRTTEALRLGTIIFSENTPNQHHPKVIKTSMGTSSSVPCKQGGIDSCPGPLIALETMETAPSLFDFEFPKAFTLLLGNEERGLKESTLQTADHVVQIPLIGSKNSLNVAAAFAIAAANIQVKKLLRMH
ncbi:MAG: TrmH family RNA methyltransferase [Simkaniaceae bacterium]|nr:MAG: TrmH family RNA methyltransferase [Simkaniaceae bacterium]